jgi:RNAse (barnase) inhibitor barstar
VHVITLAPEAAAALCSLAASLGMDAARIDLDGCTNKADFLARTAEALAFPSWFGGNWDAFFDCLADLGWRPGTGHLLVFEHTYGLRAYAPEVLDTALHILRDAAAAWEARGVPFRAFVAA